MADAGERPEAPETRTIEWFTPAGFARDYWVAKHRANARRARGTERVVLFGDSLVEQWTMPLPQWLFLGQELDTSVLEAPDGRKTGGAGWVEFFVAHTVPLVLWVLAWVFGAGARVAALARCHEWLLTHARPAYARLEASLGGPGSVVKMGIVGDRTRHCLWRILRGELDGAVGPNLRAVVLLIGMNNLIYYEDVDEREAELTPKILACAAAVEARTPPHVAVLLVCLLPLKLPYLPADAAVRAGRGAPSSELPRSAGGSARRGWRGFAGGARIRPSTKVSGAPRPRPSNRGEATPNAPRRAQVAVRANARLRAQLEERQARGALRRTKLVACGDGLVLPGTQEPDEDLIPDGVHLVERSYAIWAKTLGAKLAPMLGALAPVHN